MRLTRTQLDILGIIYLRGSAGSKDVAHQLNFSQVYVSKTISDLKEKGFLEKKGSGYFIPKNIYAYGLRNLLVEHPKTNFKEILADSRMDVLLLLFDKKTSKRIQYLSGLSKPQVYKFLKTFLKYGVVIKEGKYYKLNGVLWPDLVKFLESYSKYHDVMAYEYLPTASRVIYDSKKSKNPKINLNIFEVPRDFKVDEKTATITAFSLFGKYGITLRLNYNYFCVPPQKLGIDDVFAHAALCSNNVRKRLFTILFYLKNKELLNIEYIVEKYKLRGYLNKISAILKGETLKDYPTLDEIKQRMELYDIKH